MQAGHPHLYPMGFARGTTFMGGVLRAHAREGTPIIVINARGRYRTERVNAGVEAEVMRRGDKVLVDKMGAKIRQHRQVARETSPFGVGGDSVNEGLPSPIRVDRLAWWLKGYDKVAKKFLIDGFTFGFRVGFSGIPSSQVFKNHKSAIVKSELVDKYLAEEIKLGRIRGPLEVVPEKFNCAPIGVVPKNEKGKFRIIHDLSYPPGQSVNDGIPPEHTAVSYQSVYDAIYMLCRLGRGAYMSKTDVEKAFRIIPLHPDDQPLFCMHWQGKFYMDRVMQMGCSSSCQIFQAFASAVQWIAMTKLQIPSVNYLDDFMFGSMARTVGTEDLKRFLSMCEDIGIPIAQKKTFYPNTTMTFLGLEIDTIQNQVRLPADKLKNCVEEIRELLKHKSTRLRKLQSVIGLLNFACQVILPGRAFLRRLIDLTIGKEAPHHWIKIADALPDLAMWLEFLSHHNGTVVFVDESVLSNHDVHLYTDASGKLGYGAVFGVDWFSGVWSDWWVGKNIMMLELYPIVIAIEVWGPRLRNKRLTLFTDNMALVTVLNKQTSKDKLTMILLRRLVLVCLKNNIVLNANHVRGVSNIYSDLLSRLQIARFKAICPWASPSPTAIPQLPKSLD